MDRRELGELIDDIHRSSEPAVKRLDRGGALASRVAVLPSAFNPPTLAHMELLWAARETPDVSSVAALLTTNNVAKGLYGASLADRALMLLEVEAEGFEVPVLVSNQARIADQARIIAAEWPGLAVDMIVGFDTLVRVFDRQYYEHMEAELDAFFSSHRLIATNRAGNALGEVIEFLDRPEVRPFATQIVPREIPPEAAELSSTSARDTIAAGEHPFHLPAEVADFIRRHGLYSETDA